LIPIASAFAQGRRTLAVIRGNLAWATLYNAVAIPAAAFGFVTPLVAAIGMSTSSLAVVANALRLIRVPVKYQPSRESRSTAASSRWNLQWTS
jgi:Cu2+-exporting ATPase